MYKLSSPIIIHAGLPRTATTTLQKTVFPKYCKHPLYTKDRSASLLSRSESSILKKLDNGQKLSQPEVARTIFTGAALTINSDDRWFSILLKATDRLLTSNNPSNLPPLLSAEGLTLTTASYSLLADEAGRQFGIIPLIKAVNKITNMPPKIILCFRDPIEHFCSMFLRIARQGNIKTKDFNEYVKYQLRLEKNLQHSSNISHLYHGSLIAYLRDLGAIITPIRYTDLLKTPDALRLLNLEGDKISLSKLTKENHHLSQPSFNISNEQIKQMQHSLKRLFMALDIYNKIYKEAFI